MIVRLFEQLPGYRSSIFLQVLLRYVFLNIALDLLYRVNARSRLYSGWTFSRSTEPRQTSKLPKISGYTLPFSCLWRFWQSDTGSFNHTYKQGDGINETQSIRDMVQKSIEVLHLLSETRDDHYGFQAFRWNKRQLCNSSFTASWWTCSEINPELATVHFLKSIVLISYLDIWTSDLWLLERNRRTIEAGSRQHTVVTLLFQASLLLWPWPTESVLSESPINFFHPRNCNFLNPIFHFRPRTIGSTQ